MQFENANPNDPQAMSEALKILRESEELLPALVENLSGGAVFVVDRNLRYLMAQGEALSAAGCKPEDFVGRTIFEVLPPELSTTYEKYYRRALAGEPFETEHNSHDHWYMTRGTPLRSPNGDVYAVLTVSFDITDRKQAKEQLRRAAEMDAFRVKLTDALRSLSDPLEIQQAAMRIVGESLQVDRVMYGDITPDGKTWIARDNYTSGRLPKLIGSFPTTSFSTSVETLKRGEVVIISNVEDATDLTEAEKALYEAHNTRSALGVPLIKDGRWLSNIGVHHAEPRHWTAAEIALVQETAERTWETVERARAEAAIEADLRDTQKLHDLATRLVLEKDRQALYQEIIKTAIALTQADAGSFQVLDEITQELVLIATQGFPQTLTEHFYRLGASSNTSCGVALATGKRTLINMGQETDRVPITQTPITPYAQITVTDTGIGIAADFLPHIFEQFQQAEEKHSARGLGLGLAIAHHIVELHNGTIQAESAGAAQGTTFIIKLPLLKLNF